MQQMKFAICLFVVLLIPTVMVLLIMRINYGADEDEREAILRHYEERGELHETA